jgi:hypothetical protein
MAQLIHNMYEIEYVLSDSKKPKRVIRKMNQEQRAIYDLIKNSSG